MSVVIEYYALFSEDSHADRMIRLFVKQTNRTFLALVSRKKQNARISSDCRRQQRDREQMAKY